MAIFLFSNVMNSFAQQYVSEVEKVLDLKKDNGVVVWGSSNSERFSRESDLDMWLVTPSELPFQEAYKLSQAEFSYRKKFGEKHQLSEFAKHRVSIFSSEEAALYLRTFYWRYYLALTKFSEGEAQNYAVPEVSLNMEDIQTDLVVTVGERLETAYLKNKEYLLSYNQRDYEYYRQHHSSMELGAQKSLHDTIDFFVRESSLDFAQRRQLHALLWSLEKVRWELLNSYEDPKYFDKWKKGEHEGFGYSLATIGSLLVQLVVNNKSHVTEQLKQLGRLLTKQLIKDTTEDIPAIYSLLSSVLVATATGQTTDEDKDTYSVTFPVAGKQDPRVCKLSNDAKYIISEHEGQRRYMPTPPEHISLGAISYVLSPVLKAKTYNIQKTEKIVMLLKSLHSSAGHYFGRVGAGPHFATYHQFLFHRICKLPQTCPFRSDLLRLTGVLRTILNTSQPVACHMDAHAGNILVMEDREVLIDWEHLSYCAREWDVERAIRDYPVPLQEAVRKQYYSDVVHNPIVSLFTRIVVMTCGASRILEPEKKNNIYVHVNQLLNELHSSLPKNIRSRTNQNSPIKTAAKNRSIDRRRDRTAVASTPRENTVGV